MRVLRLLIFCFLVASASYAQEIERSVVASAGENFSNGNFQLSFTLGEVVTETFADQNYILNQGFQQVIEGVLISGFDLDVMAFLEGPFADDQMETILNENELIPSHHPYNNAPWNYSGNEYIASIPSEMVDWVLVELRDAPNADAASPATMVAQKAGLLQSDGRITDVDGNSLLSFNETISYNLFVVVWHRNHLGIMSANGLNQNGNIYTYDFSDAMEKAYGNLAQKDLGNGYFGLLAGDANADNGINHGDRTGSWSSQAGKRGYLSADFSMDGQTNNQDKNDLWKPNLYKGSQVPD